MDVPCNMNRVNLSTWGEAIVAAAKGNAVRMGELLSGKDVDGRGVDLRTFRTSWDDVDFMWYHLRIRIDANVTLVEIALERDHCDVVTLLTYEPEAEDAQLAAAIAASLTVSEHPVARVKRWGDGLEAPAAGSRHFVPQGFELKLDVPEAIECFGHSKSHVGKIMDAGRAKASKSPTPLAPKHAAALFAYTEETTLYGTLNYTMRTPHTPSTPTDTELKHYADYIVHTVAALSSLPTHVSEMQGKVYRGIKVLLNPDIYAPGKQITWQGFSSSTKKQTATLDFVTVQPGRKLQGSLFVIDSITAKDIRHFSAIPSEEEVLFPPNSQFKVEKVVTSEPEKKALLSQLGAYDMTDLDVYVLKQIA